MRCPTCSHPISEAVRVERSVRTDATGRPVWEMWQGDSLELLAKIEPRSVEAVITDPPYGSGGFSTVERMQSSKSKYVNSDSKYQEKLPDIAGDSLMPDHWRAQLNDWMRAVARVLVEGGVLLSFIDWRNLSEMHAAVATAGLVPRSVVIWDKGRGSRPHKGGFRRQSEMICWATRGPMRVWSEVYLDGVLKHSTISQNKVHITQKPITLMRELILITPKEGMIFDPFAGAGTTGVAAIEGGRRFLGIEMVPEYFDVAVRRLREAEATLPHE